MTEPNNDRIEYYHGSHMVAAVRSSMVPHVGSMISIRGEAWSVTAVTFALDYADKSYMERSMRCNVDVEIAK